MTDEKYLINVDFPAESIVHLNPLLYQTSSNCKTGIKNPEHGGLMLVTDEEVSNHLDGIVSLKFHGKKITNLRRCKICRTKEVEHET